MLQNGVSLTFTLLCHLYIITTVALPLSYFLSFSTASVRLYPKISSNKLPMVVFSVNQFLVSLSAVNIVSNMRKLIIFLLICGRK